MNLHKKMKKEEIAAYDFVEKMISKADGKIYNFSYYWYGWALREAFEAGFRFCKAASNKQMKQT